ncbi:MAG: ABC transporter permease [Oscillospiraceae bacterium]|nr:ABC transporter permease [Oscillospiraceae bacterium]
MLKRFFSQAWLYQKGRTAAFKLPEFLCFDAGYPVITLIFYCLLAAYSFRTRDLSRWVIGNAFLMCTNTCVFGLGNLFRSERYSGRLRSIVAAPCSKLAVVLSGGVFPTLFAAVAVALGFLVGALIFGVDFSGVPLGYAALTILCAMASATCFGLLLSVFGLITDSMNMVLNVVSYLLMLFTGAEFPVAQLPAAGRVLSRLLPLTRAMEAMSLLFGEGRGSFGRLLLGELAVAGAYALLAWAIFGLADRICRRSGKLDLY